MGALEVLTGLMGPACAAQQRQVECMHGHLSSSIGCTHVAGWKMCMRVAVLCRAPGGCLGPGFGMCEAADVGRLAGCRSGMLPHA